MTPATSTMNLLVALVHGSSKSSILDAAGLLDWPLSLLGELF